MKKRKKIEVKIFWEIISTAYEEESALGSYGKLEEEGRSHQSTQEKKRNT